MVKIKVLSHACMLVSTDESSIIIDPWLTGSCYWRSWWNYPKPDIDIKELNSVDAIFISHIHWDHWHGPSLKKFFRGKKVYIGDDPNQRSFKDIKNIGFDDVEIIKHQQNISVGDIKISFHSFGTFLNDSAIVIQSQGISILNANDSKIAGPPLKHLIKKYGCFDFAFRSHSSANTRVCYKVKNESTIAFDDREHYFRSYKLFMDAINPKYAIPFASNHCHLMKENFHFNDYVSNPEELKEYLNLHNTNSWEFVMMLPGSSWSSDRGFELKNQESFKDYKSKLLYYREDVKDRLQFYKEKEEAVIINQSVFAKFKLMASKCRNLKDISAIKFVLNKPSGTYMTLIWDGNDISAGDINNIVCEPGIPAVYMSAQIFKDAVIKNMFHHAGISKRCEYIAFSQRDIESLKQFISGLERQELIGSDNAYWFRLIMRQIRRFQDLKAYTIAFYYRFIKKMPMYLVEGMLLKYHSK